MKILMVSIFSNHFFNWTEQLKNSGHEIYWIDVLDMDIRVERIDFVRQITGWRNRYEYPGRYWIKHKLPSLHQFIGNFNQRSFINEFKKRLLEIQPDVVHSFEMNSGALPILEIMQNHRNIKWIYTAWGNDFYYSKGVNKRSKMEEVFMRLDYLFTDCYRDYEVAKRLGFKGEYLGTFPGGGGYNLKEIGRLIEPMDGRKIILVKGYENKFGRCNVVLKGLSCIKENLNDYKVVVFGADQKVKQFADKLGFQEDIEINGRIGREKVLQLMGKAAIYIGNSISDGTPNTLIESILMGAFPIQSNPGGATAEIIQHGRNGFLIENPEEYKGISTLILLAIQNSLLRKKATQYNTINLKPKFARELIKKEVVKKYHVVQDHISGYQKLPN